MRRVDEREHARRSRVGMCERDSADAKMSEEHVHTDIQQRAQSPPLALPPSVRPWFAHGHTLTLPPRASQAKSANGTNKGVASRPHRSRQSPHGVEDQVAHRELPHPPRRSWSEELQDKICKRKCGARECVRMCI